jgi:choline monooxygenase
MSLDLPAADIEAALAPLRTAMSMPAEIYTSPAIFAAERDRIFLRHWFFLCREDQLPNIGDYRAFDTQGGPIFLVRGQDGLIRCFANYCRHRGSLLVKGSGNCGARLMCPYHAWSYFSDGRLYGCPDMQDAEGFDRLENGLVALRCDTWAGFVFASFAPDGPGLMDQLGDLPARFASHRLEKMRCTWTTEIVAECNWKLVLENAMETYHTGTVHRDSIGAQTQRAIPTRGDWLCIQVLSRTSIGSLDRSTPPFDQIEGLDDAARAGTYFTILHPLTQFAVAQDCMWWLNVRPLTESRSVIEIGGCFPETIATLPDFPERSRAYEDRWKRVAMEDVGVLEDQQRALGSALFRPGPLSGRDDMVHAAGRWNIEKLLA